MSLTVFQDRSFSFEIKTPPASDLLRKAAGVEKGSGSPRNEKIATLPQSTIRAIAEQKFRDLNAADVDGAMRIIEGTARSMGIQIDVDA